MRTRDLLYPLSILKQILHLPKIAHHTQLREADVDARLATLSDDLKTITGLANKHEAHLQDVSTLLDTIDTKVASLKHTLSKRMTASESVAAETPVNNTVADDHTLDSFYKLFEDKFRGSEEDIKKRVAEYKPLFDTLGVEVKKQPVIDLGCGRGEFLAFAKENGIKAIGIDMNFDMVDRAKALGFTAHRTDAMSYILKQKANSVSAITGFHIVEHIPFDALMRLFDECYRVVSRGGFVLFETPNPKNLIIGSNNFYIDPSHIKPVPPELLSFALESVGFKVEVIPTHPQRKQIRHKDSEVAALMELVYGPQDYAVVARKY